MQIYNNAQNTIYMNRLEKTIKRNFAASPEGLSWLSPFRSYGSQDSQTGGSWEAAKGTNTKLAQGGHKA